MHRMIGVQLGAAALLVGCATRSPVPVQHEVRHEYAWETVEECARLIDLAPEWPTARDLTQAELKRLASIASTLGKWQADEYEIALVVFMARSASLGIGREQAAWTKPFLIHRMMFELPNDQPVDFDTMSFAPPSAGAASERFASPFDWSASEPRLATRRIEVEWSGPAYQPHLEYRHLSSRFHKRDLNQIYDDLAVEGRRILDELMRTTAVREGSWTVTQTRRR